jgi:uncharacterized DUF497 family protein
MKSNDSKPSEPHRKSPRVSFDNSIYRSYIKGMKIEFDPVKDVANQAKHGVSLSMAVDLDWEAALVGVDERFEYDESRMIALAPQTEILYYVAFVDRGEVRRVISLRRANRREVKHYVENL